MKALQKLITLSLVPALFSLAGCKDKKPTEKQDKPIVEGENIVTPENAVDENTLNLFPGPSIMETSDLASVKVNGQDVFVYETRVNHRRSFTFDYSTDLAPVCIFDFSGVVHVDVTIPGVTEITSAKLSPLDYGIKTEINNNTISFDLSNPTDYILEYNNDPTKAIHFFTSLPEEDPITKEEAAADSNIMYFGPGVYKVDSLPIKSGMTLYLAGGSYLYGQALAGDLENVTIRGRGIFDGAIYDRRAASEKLIPIELQRCNNVKIEGVTILDPAGWAIAMIDSTNVTIENTRIISARANGDGISLQSCHDVNVKGGFVRSWDDSLVVKNINRGTTENITFDGVSVWTDLAQSMEVGYETNGPTMKNINFKNITVIHNFHKAAMSIHNCDDAEVDTVNFENITIEDGAMLGDVQDDGLNDFLIDMTIAYNPEWTKSEGRRGKVRNVSFKNIKVDSLSDSILCRMIGESNDSSIDTVTIENLNIEGKRIDSEEKLKLTKNEFAKNINFKSNDEVAGAMLTLKYKNNSTLSSKTNTNKTEQVQQEGIIVPEVVQQLDNLAYIGEKNIPGETTVQVTHGKGSTSKDPYDDGTGSYAKNEVSQVIDGDRATTLEFKDYTGETNEFIALTLTFPEITRVGVLRLLGDYNNQLFSRYNISVYGRKLKSDGVTENQNFIRVLSAADYQLSPSKGNYFDINFTPDGFFALQLRFFRKDGIGYSQKVKIGEIEFYQPSLTYGKSIVYSTEHNDVYNVERIVDGNSDGTSYYESKSLPAEIVIDLGQVYTLNSMVMFLPGGMAWTARTQNIELLTSDSINDFNSDSTKFTQAVEAKDYVFDPASGNMNKVDVSSKNIKARFIKIVINTNSASGNYGGQLSEFNAYGK